MTEPQIIEAIQPVFVFLGAKLSANDWHQYALALDGVNPGDLDDALEDVRKTHAFRNAPLPADLLRRCEDARKSRVAASQTAHDITAPEPIQTGDGELKTFTLPGGPTLTMRVLPDDHPALRRFACFDCQDSGWADGPKTALGNPSVVRCRCYTNNPVLALERARRADRQRSRA